MNDQGLDKSWGRSTLLPEEVIATWARICAECGLPEEPVLAPAGQMLIEKLWHEAHRRDWVDCSWLYEFIMDGMANYQDAAGDTTAPDQDSSLPNATRPGRHRRISRDLERSAILWSRHCPSTGEAIGSLVCLREAADESPGWPSAGMHRAIDEVMAAITVEVVTPATGDAMKTVAGDVMAAGVPRDSLQVGAAR